MSNALEMHINTKVKSTPLLEAEKATSKLENAFMKADKKLDKFKNTTIKANSNTNTLTNSMNKQKTASTSLLGSVKSLVAGYVGFHTIKQTINMFTSFEDKMLRVKGLLGDAAENEFPKLEKQAKDLGKATAFSASQVAEAQGNLIQGGLKANEVLQATPGILDAASAAQLDMATASEIVVGQLNAFKLEAKQASQVADILTKAQSISAVSVQGLGESLVYAGSSAKAMGFDINDTVAILGVLGDANTKGSMAGTSLNATFTDISKNSKKLNALGVSVVDINGDFRKLEDIMIDVTKATDGMTSAQRKSTLQNIFGERAMKTVDKLMGDGALKVREYKKELEESAGFSSRMAKTMESGLGGTLRKLWSATEGLAISLGGFLKPAITGLANVLMGAASVLSDVTDYMNSGTVGGDILTGIVWGLTAAFAVNKAVMLANAVTATGLTVAQTALATVTGGLTTAFNLLNLSNPLGWIAIGITAIVILWKRFEGFRNFLKGTWELLKKFFEFTPIGMLIKVGTKLSEYFGENKKRQVSFSTQYSNNVNSSPVYSPMGTPTNYVAPSMMKTEQKNITKNNNNYNAGNTTVINVPVNNSVNSKELGSRIKKVVKAETDKYNREQVINAGGRA